MDTRFTRGKSNILERPLTRPKTEVNVSAFALLFSEMVQYCQSRVYSVSELQTRLADMGQSVGASMLDVLVLREKNGKRETKVLNMLLFIKVREISNTYELSQSSVPLKSNHFYSCRSTYGSLCSGRRRTSWSRPTTTTRLTTSSRRSRSSTPTSLCPRRTAV